MLNRAQHIAYVRKSSDIMFETLQAFGIAELFRQVNISKPDLKIEIADIGVALRITVNVSSEEMRFRITENGLPSLLPAIIPLYKLIPSSPGKKQKYDS